MAEIKEPVRLKTTRISSFGEFITWFIEYWVFFRWMYFKNHPRGNFPALSSLLYGRAFCGFYYLIFSHLDFVIAGVDVDPIILFSILITAGYWNMINTFHEKTNHCSILYNDYIKELGAGNIKGAKLTANFLATKLVTLDLWAHRAFVHLFANELEKAIDEGFSGEEKTKMYEKVNNGKLEIREARQILQNYHQSMLRLS